MLGEREREGKWEEGREEVREKMEWMVEREKECVEGGREGKGVNRER